MSKSTRPSPPVSPDSSHTTSFVSNSLALMGRAMVFGAAFGAQLSSRDLEILAVALLSLHDRLSPAPRQKEEAQ